MKNKKKKVVSFIEPNLRNSFGNVTKRPKAEAVSLYVSLARSVNWPAILRIRGRSDKENSIVIIKYHIKDLAKHRMAHADRSVSIKRQKNNFRKLTTSVLIVKSIRLEPQKI